MGATDRSGPGGPTAWFAIATGLLLAVASSAPALQVRGNVEVGWAARHSEQGPHDGQILNTETRLLLEHQRYGEQGEMLDLRGLAVQDFRGDASLEVREASVLLPLGTSWEITAGRQILSWGPAQFEFVNDRFAKDFGSFFVGRDLEYLKAPNDAVRVRWFPGSWTVDMVLTPVFQPDRIPDPDVFPVLDPATGEPAADPEFRPIRPERDLANGEVHLRVDRRLGRWEVALYGYRGFTGRPEGVREQDGELSSFHPRMAATGLSLRGPVAGGIGWFEGAFEDIREAGAGSDPALPADRWLALGGYRWNPSPTRTWMVQAGAVGQVDAGELRNALDEANPNHPRARQVDFRVQASLSQTFLMERLDTGARLFWGLTEQDVHWRLRLSYEFSDQLFLEVRHHGFAADHPASRFGLLRDYDLFGIRARYYL